MYRIVPPKMDKRLFRLQICSPAATYGADPAMVRLIKNA